MSGNELQERPNASHGLWCSLLLPASLLGVSYQIPGTGIHLILSVLSFSLLAVLLSKIIYLKKELPSTFSYWIYGIAAVVTFCILWKFCDFGFHIALLTVFISFYLFDWLYKTLLWECPASFTMGEAAVVAQGITLFIIGCLFSFKEFMQQDEDPNEVVQSTKFLQVLLLGCCILIFLLHQFPYLHSFFGFYSAGVFVALLMLISWSAYLQQNPVLWLFVTCIISLKRIFLILSWTGLVMIAILFTAWHKEQGYTPGSTVIRKYFHVMIVSIYVPGLVWDVEFLYLASAVVFSIFLVLETIRVLKVPPLGSAIDSAFSPFLDEKDTGLLVLSNIYLLIGCSCPLWLYPPQNGMNICHWSGVISVGLGDTIAAVSGTAYGKHKWPGSKKTVEGTVCATVVQVLALLAILYFCNIFTVRNIFVASVAAVLTSVVEALTTQVDNLVLPLFMFSVLSYIN